MVSIKMKRKKDLIAGQVRAIQPPDQTDFRMVHIEWYSLRINLALALIIN